MAIQSTTKVTSTGANPARLALRFSTFQFIMQTDGLHINLVTEMQITIQLFILY